MEKINGLLVVLENIRNFMALKVASAKKRQINRTTQ